MGNLTDLLEKLKSEIEKQLGRKVYSHPIGKGTGWALTKEIRRNNFGNIWMRVKFGKYCSLPHLLVAIDSRWALKAEVAPEFKDPTGWYGEPAGYWCVPANDNGKLKKIAGYLVMVYLSK